MMCENEVYGNPFPVKMIEVKQTNVQCTIITAESIINNTAEDNKVDDTEGGQGEVAQMES